MRKEDYFNSVTDQVLALREMNPIQADKCFDLEKLQSVFPAEAAGKIRRVIVTGCGDSYSAAGAMLKGMRRLSGLRDLNSPDIMDFCRFYTDEKIYKGFRPEEVLLVAISFSGGSERVAEALQRGAQKGIHALLITRNSESKSAQAAGYVFNVETPEGCNTPGLCSYFASLMGLAAMGAYLGVCNGNLTADAFVRTKTQIVDFVASFMADIEKVDDQMFALAQQVKDYRHFEMIADGNEGYSAQFVEQKFIECGGVYADHTTSEEFAHISIFFRQPETYVTVVMVNRADPSLKRMKDTVDGCLKQHRPTLVVTDVEEDFFRVRTGGVDPSVNIYGRTPVWYDSSAEAGTAVVCRIPTAPQQWMSPFVDFLPGSLLAGYQAAVNERHFFGGRYDFRAQTWNRG